MDVDLADVPAVTESGKWRYWRCALGDGTRLVVTIEVRATGKTGLTITHKKLTSAEDKEHCDPCSSCRGRFLVPLIKVDVTTRDR